MHSPDTPAPSRPRRLSALLRDGTREEHTRAERVAFVGAMARGTLSREDYRRLLAALHVVYTELESGLEAREGDPRVGPFANRALFRREALARDLAFFGGAPHAGVAAAAERYRARLRHVATEQPVLLVAHAYTRYLGDLSGGQILRRGIARGFGLEGMEGQAFYDFSALGDPAAVKARFRQSLDELPLSTAEEDAVVREAKRAFSLNQALFEELGQQPEVAQAL